jgi:acetyl-CoA carboxylase biotin carboxyl carrier protein
MAQNDSDINRIKRLIEIMKENDLVELEINSGDEKILLKRAQAQPQQVVTHFAPAVTPPVAVGPQVTQAGTGTQQGEGAELLEELTDIRSPIVGTFYSAPSPDSEPYVDIGSEVEPQTLVCIIEAMKVMNEIKAETAGTISEILVKNGQAVEFGEVLFKVRPG